MVFLLALAVVGAFHGKRFRWGEYGGAGLLSQRAETLYAGPNEKAEAATSSYFAAGDFVQYIYSVLVGKNHLKI